MHMQVIAGLISNRSRGYGFVRFGSEQERDMALGQMNGIHINNRAIRVSLATAKKSPGEVAPSPVAQPSHPSDFDPTNTTLFIGGLGGGVPEEQLQVVFAAYGDIVYVKVPPGKSCGFVQFVQRTAAERAINHMQGSFWALLQLGCHGAAATRSDIKHSLQYTRLAMHTAPTQHQFLLMLQATMQICWLSMAIQPQRLTRMRCIMLLPRQVQLKQTPTR